MLKFSNSPSLKALEQALKTESKILLEGLFATPKAWLATFIATVTNRNVIMITGGVREDLLFHELSFFSPSNVLELPSWETLPGEEIRPSPDILGKRFSALDQICKRKNPSVILCPLQSVLQKILPRNILKEFFQTWEIGSKIEFSKIPEILTSLGYKREPLVSDKGQFSIRGGIVDLFPVSALEPMRVDFFGDVIEKIKTFDPVGQKSTGQISSFFLSPADELSLLQKADRLQLLPDFLNDPWIFWDDLLAIEDLFVSLQSMPAAQSLYMAKIEDLFKKYDNHIFCSSQNIEEMSHVLKSKDRSKYFQNISFEAFNQKLQAQRFFHPFKKIETIDDIEKEIPCVFINRTDLEEQEVKKKIIDKDLVSTQFLKGDLQSSFSCLDANQQILAYSLFSGKTVLRRQKWRTTHHTPASEFHALNPGDLVVHYHSGIAKYLGLEKQKNHLGVETEFLILEFANTSKLFVPLSQAYLVSRYIGTVDSTPTLSELGSKRWTKIKEAATAQIVGYASDLLQRQAERIVSGGFAFPKDGDLMEKFEKEFPYTETDDQLLAITAIKKDMMEQKPMDRLICGDVGYGKTEVAMRAAFKAVADGNKQVAVLVPTTVLAHQHFDTFEERMRGFGVSIAVISRFKTPKQVKQIITDLKDGKIDILIGTHRILSQDVVFKNLGLIIIDEEQRFGVRSKEHLKKLKVDVDCLTLSATPIPRTLHMSLVTAKDMSVIATPPQDRLPIKTIIAEADSELIQNALIRELARSGQAFYIHNRVDSIYGKADEVQKLVPQARVDVVHGQMDADDIDHVFHKFKTGSIDILFATTIIESGIDIPNANTMIIERADTYGLADLYQLRGRVGRWNRAAYAYFLMPKHTKVTETAKKRLYALAEASGFGGGMKIAMRDLEIRGAGDILGVQQSGQVSSIGFHLYCKLLKRAIDSLKKQKPISFLETKMEFSYPASLPEFYINEVSLRMEIYHRLGEVSTLPETEEILSEITDRFGTPPEPVLWLYHLTRVRIFAKDLRCSLVKFGALSVTVERLLGKEVKTYSFLLPKKLQTPKELEVFVISELSRVIGSN